MSSDCGYVSGPGCTIRSPSAGAASASSTPPATNTESTGRRRTRSTIAPQTRPSPLPRRRMCGTRSRSTRSPSFESSAGRTVSEPDQQDRRRHLLRDRQQLTRQRDQPERREDRREREQQRDACGHERPECHHEDDQRDRDREYARALEVLCSGLVDRLLRARVAELADEEARVGGLRVVDAIQDRADLVAGIVLVAPNVELHERGALVLRDLAS